MLHSSSIDNIPLFVPRLTSADRRWRPGVDAAPNCPRCDSTNTKFCYYNNYSLAQPRYFCKGCRRYWTKGGSLRNVPVGGGCRKSRRGKPVRLSVTGHTTVPPSSTPSPIRPDVLLDDPGAGSTAPDIDLAVLYAKFLNPGNSGSSPGALPEFPVDDIVPQLPREIPVAADGFVAWGPPLVVDPQFGEFGFNPDSTGCEMDVFTPWQSHSFWPSSDTQFVAGDPLANPWCGPPPFDPPSYEEDLTAL